MKGSEARVHAAIRPIFMILFAVSLALFLGPPTGLAQGKGTATAAQGMALAAAIPGLPLDENHSVGAPVTIKNLVLFPIYAQQQEDVGEITTLDAALERGTAVVREVGSTAPAQAGPHHHQRAGVAQGAGDAGVVNTLVIENKGKLPIFVLAGTVVKGGKQDRQIGEDFLIGAGKTVPVDAFCVEHGRWAGVRDGEATGGVFKATKTLATAKVRAAGQHARNQSGVWAEVSAVNAANKKAAPSGTLMATLDDKAVVAQRTAIAAKAAEHFAKAHQSDRIVGIAYAVSGKVRAVRWFWSHKLFALHRDTLVNTAAVEAITAASAAVGTPAESPAAAPAAVVRFIADIQKAGVAEKRATRAGNVNEYKSAPVGYGARTLAPAPTAASPYAPPAGPKAISVDFIAQ